MSAIQKLYTKLFVSLYLMPCVIEKKKKKKEKEKKKSHETQNSKLKRIFNHPELITMLLRKLIKATDIFVNCF
jgi:fucose permease